MAEKLKQLDEKASTRAQALITQMEVKVAQQTSRDVGRVDMRVESLGQKIKQLEDGLETSQRSLKRLDEQKVEVDLLRVIENRMEKFCTFNEFVKLSDRVTQMAPQDVVLEVKEKVRIFESQFKEVKLTNE